MEVASLQYCKADDMLALLRTQCPNVVATKFSEASAQSGGSPKTSEGIALTGTNSKIVLSGAGTDVATAQQMVAQVDESMKTQITGQRTEIYRVKYVKPSELAKALVGLIPGVSVGSGPGEGFDLTAPADIQQSTSGSTVKSSETSAGQTAPAASGSTDKQTSDNGVSFDQKTKSRTLVIFGQSDDVQAALDLAAKLDTKAPQIKIEAKITSITESDAKQLGINWDWSASFSKPDQFIYDFTGTLDALITNDSDDLLASPSLLCLEGKPGVFFVGDEVTYVSSVSAATNGQATYNTSTITAGIQLRVICAVSDDGYITLDMHPEVSTYKLNAIDPSGSGDEGYMPTVHRSFTDHTVRVKSGQTFAIGGLISSEEIDDMTKVPILGDLPFFGHLFRHINKTKDHTQVVMFITASVVSD